MRLAYLGHACFSATAEDGTRVVFDPYRPGALHGRIRHGPIREPADIVAVTHFHEDHGWIGGVPGDPVIVDETREVRDLRFQVSVLPHDPDGGVRMGLTRLVVAEIDGVRILHPGDLGRAPTPPERRRLGAIDLVLLPVGGHYTLPSVEALAFADAVAPRWIVPMHYRSDKVVLPRMESLDEFLVAASAHFPLMRLDVSELDWTGASGPTTVMALEPLL